MALFWTCMYMGYTFMSISLGSGLWVMQQGRTGFDAVLTAFLSCLFLSIPSLLLFGLLWLMINRAAWTVIFWGCAIVNVYMTVA